MAADIAFLVIVEQHQVLPPLRPLGRLTSVNQAGADLFPSISSAACQNWVEARVSFALFDALTGGKCRLIGLGRIRERGDREVPRLGHGAIDTAAYISDWNNHHSHEGISRSPAWSHQ